MNWGKSIFIAYLGFVGFMGFLVWKCLQQKDIHLVSKDYYQKEIAYQQNIDQMNNTNELSSDLGFTYNAEHQNIQLMFPKESAGASGVINFYRPSDANKDFSVNMNLPDSSIFDVPVKNISKGLWVIKVSWSKNGKNYYKEEKIVL